VKTFIRIRRRSCGYFRKGCKDDLCHTYSRAERRKKEKGEGKKRAINPNQRYEEIRQRCKNQRGEEGEYPALSNRERHKFLLLYGDVGKQKLISRRLKGGEKSKFEWIQGRGDHTSTAVR